MLQKQKKPVRVGEGEQPKSAAKVIETPQINDLAEKMKKATKEPESGPTKEKESRRCGCFG